MAQHSPHTPPLAAVAADEDRASLASVTPSEVMRQGCPAAGGPMGRGMCGFSWLLASLSAEFNHWHEVLFPKLESNPVA